MALWRVFRHREVSSFALPSPSSSPAFSWTVDGGAWRVQGFATLLGFPYFRCVAQNVWKIQASIFCRAIDGMAWSEQRCSAVLSLAGSAGRARYGGAADGVRCLPSDGNQETD
jgi:hypothetical protein